MLAPPGPRARLALLLAIAWSAPAPGLAAACDPQLCQQQGRSTCPTIGSSECGPCLRGVPRSLEPNSPCVGLLGDASPSSLVKTHCSHDCDTAQQCDSMKTLCTDAACTWQCSGSQSCGSAEFHCRGDENKYCSVDCSAPQSCSFSKVNCGKGACKFTGSAAQSIGFSEFRCGQAAAWLDCQDGCSRVECSDSCKDVPFQLSGPLSPISGPDSSCTALRCPNPLKPWKCPGVIGSCVAEPSLCDGSWADFPDEPTWDDDLIKDAPTCSRRECGCGDNARFNGKDVPSANSGHGGSFAGTSMIGTVILIMVAAVFLAVAIACCRRRSAAHGGSNGGTMTRLAGGFGGNTAAQLAGGGYAQVRQQVQAGAPGMWPQRQQQQQQYEYAKMAAPSAAAPLFMPSGQGGPPPSSQWQQQPRQLPAYAPPQAAVGGHTAGGAPFAAGHAQQATPVMSAAPPLGGGTAAAAPLAYREGEVGESGGYL